MALIAHLGGAGAALRAVQLCRVHGSVRIAPAMAAGITEHVGSDRIDCSMTEKGYEHEYSEALAELRSRGSKVASPYKTAPGGIREVRIDNFRCIDRLVFERAWGHQIAAKIMSEKPSPR